MNSANVFNHLAEGGSGKTSRVDALTQVARVQLRDEKRSGAGRIFPLLFLAVLFLLLMAALAMGVRAYRSTARAQSSLSTMRSGAELVANSVRANDATGSIAVGEGPEGRSLVVVEKLPTGTYEIRTYLYQGSIMQEYAIAGSRYTPGSATRITDSETFDFSFSNGLLSISTDMSSCEVALRNLQGGE